MRHDCDGHVALLAIEDGATGDAAFKSSRCLRLVPRRRQPLLVVRQLRIMSNELLANSARKSDEHQPAQTRWVDGENRPRRSCADQRGTGMLTVTP